jgi:hypothetical protein
MQTKTLHIAERKYFILLKLRNKKSLKQLIDENTFDFLPILALFASFSVGNSSKYRENIREIINTSNVFLTDHNQSDRNCPNRFNFEDSQIQLC